MGESTAIGWTDHTFNPWWGCTRVSPGCQNCYAESFAKRTGNDVWGTSPRRFFGDKHWREPLKWAARAFEAGERRKVFCASMADVFEDHPDVIKSRHRLFELIDRTAVAGLDWLLLTKRPELIGRFADHWTYPGIIDPDRGFGEYDTDWPSNVWIGTTVEDQDRAKSRLDDFLLFGKGAAVRFLSCEPLLEEIDLTPWFDEGIDWVICGGESGPRHRPLDLDHARSLRDQCQAFGVPFFFKQVGGRFPTAGGDELDGETWKQFPKIESTR